MRRISMERLKMKDFPRRETDSAEVLERIGHLEHCAAELAQAAKAVMETDSRNPDTRERLRKYLMTVDEAYVSAYLDTVTVIPQSAKMRSDSNSMALGDLLAERFHHPGEAD